MERSRELSQRLGQLRWPCCVRRWRRRWSSIGVYARIADLLAIPAPLPSSVRDGLEMTEILRGSSDRARGRTIPLTSISIQPSPEWIEQDRAYKRRLGWRVVKFLVSIFCKPAQLLSVHRGWAKGLYFRSQSSLDSGDEADLARANTLRALATEFAVAVPLDAIVGGSIDDPTRAVFGLQRNDSFRYRTAN